MYRKRGDSLSIKEILAKLSSTPESTPVVMVYSSSDISKAKNVLDRLLRCSERNEVTFIREVVTEIEELEDSNARV